MTTSLQTPREIARHARELAKKRQREAKHAPLKLRAQLVAVATNYNALAAELERVAAEDPGLKTEN